MGNKSKVKTDRVLTDEQKSKVYQERQKYDGFMQKACAVRRRGDGREQGFKTPTKMKFGGLQLVAGRKPLPIAP